MLISRAARASALIVTVALVGCADLGAVRDFGRSAAAVSAYPQAAAAYADSARTSAAFVAGSPESFVPRGQRQAQADDAIALHAAVGDYFATLARLAGDDEFTPAKLKALAADSGHAFRGSFDRTTIDGYVGLTRTLTRFAETPARERAVRALVLEGGPPALRIVGALRRVAADWRAQVANDAKQVDDTLLVAVLPGDVPPLLRILANDRRAELALGYAATLRKMRAADTALAAVENAHAELVLRLDDLAAPAAQARLQRATTELRAAASNLGLAPGAVGFTEMPP